MANLDSGDHAPTISLSLTDAGKSFSLSTALGRGPVLAAFFKISCPVCQLTFPYLERLHKAYGSSKFTLIGISQDNASESISFAKQYGVTFPIALDPTGQYPVSNGFRLTNVPSLFWISPSGTIEFTMVGWERKAMDKLNEFAALASGVAQKQLFRAGDKAPDFTPG